MLWGKWWEPKPPLCKGRWRGAPEGLGGTGSRIRQRSGEFGRLLRAIPPSASLTAPLYTREPWTCALLGLPCVREAVMASGHDGRVVFAPLREISIRAEGTPLLTTGHETLTAGRSSSLPARAVGDRPYGVKRKSVRNSRRGQGTPPYGRCSTVPARADAPARGMPHP